MKPKVRETKTRHRKNSSHNECKSTFLIIWEHGKKIIYQNNTENRKYVG